MKSFNHNLIFTFVMIKFFRFYLVLAAVLLPLCGWGQEKLFDKYSDMKNVKSVYISKPMLEMGPEYFTNIYLGSSTKKLNSVRLLSTSDSVVCKKLFKDIRSLLKPSDYKLLMKQKGTSTSSEFYVSKYVDIIEELIMLTYKEDKFLRFIYLEGKMTEKDVKDILLYQGTSDNVIH